MPIGERLEPRFGRLGREYPKVVFDKALLPTDPTLEWVTPGHPLFEVVREDVARARRATTCARGAIFYDLQRKEPARLDAFAASVKDGRGDCLHRRLFVVETEMSGAMTVRQPTVFLDGLVPAPSGTAVPMTAHSPIAAQCGAGPARAGAAAIPRGGRRGARAPERDGPPARRDLAPDLDRPPEHSLADYLNRQRRGAERPRPRRADLPRRRDTSTN